MTDFRSLDETWKGRRMRIWFHVAKNKEFMRDYEYCV